MAVSLNRAPLQTPQATAIPMMGHGDHQKGTPDFAKKAHIVSMVSSGHAGVSLRQACWGLNGAPGALEFTVYDVRFRLQFFLSFGFRVWWFLV